ncbi:WD40 repeat-like protein [Coniochaeta ligniaria NRRL 30616]|uniref:WD40 repeat-like protein n=1 Tax=Coniochaeta ligniaria NRRL 30616 TaxID=1408157 RepID=A0A1J7IWX7_9PEZI|nr:WD40 repeat-like protein [Coniochaeta ligniaria NRRL 30616]
MDDFAAQEPDEGYSEDPLNPTTTQTSAYLAKPRNDAVSALAATRSTIEFPDWLMSHIASLSVHDKTQLAMALLDDLPTGVIAQIVEQLNPRLYIDFIRYLPPEVCLKILGYLDPLSLINVARSCRAWYDLALDRKLWEQLYYLEGWKAKPEEIERWEKIVNDGSLSGFPGQLSRMVSSENGHIHKKRAISASPGLDAGGDIRMVDVDASIKQEPSEMEVEESSIFGGVRPNAARTSGLTQPLAKLQVDGSGSTAGSRREAINKGKGKARDSSPVVREGSLPDMVPFGLQKQTLWMWDAPDSRYKINWKYLYTMRRRLESNWELGKYANFQLPHPNHPEEGHNECIYSLQYNSQYLVSGSRDRTIRIWDLETRRLVRPPLAAHSGSVLCLQFDSDPEEDLIVSGSSDSDVILWRFSTGEVIQRLRDAHRESVLNVKFDKRILVTCSKDKTIKIFNRRPLRYGDMGYPSKEVDTVPRQVKNYGYAFSPMDQLPVIPAYTMIGTLEGHGAAVNAVQIHDREVVSASGDRHIKVWDWPNGVCTRTVVGHSKGIACVQYDGRRIVSGSSDNEVKVFDRQTGLEVASLRSHSNLVRTVQAGFADLPYSTDDDEADAKAVDLEYFKAVESGQLDEQDRPRQRRPGNAGSRRPEDITAYGAKLPPGGGGGKYGRIVSGSYDTSIIIWRRDKEGIWKDHHHLKQEDAAAAAVRAERTPQVAIETAAPIIPLHHSVHLRPPTVRSTVANAGQSAMLAVSDAASGSEAARTQSASAPPAMERPTTPPGTVQMTEVESPIHAIVTPRSIEEYKQMIDLAIPGGPQALAQALASYPTMLTQRSHLQAAIDREPSPFVRSQLRQAVNTALIRTQFEQARQRREAVRNFERHLAAGESSTAGGLSQQTQTANSAAPAIVVGTFGGAHGAAAAESQERPADAQPRQVVAGGAFHDPPEIHLHQLQFDAHRIICCSQTSVIVGWDFNNADPELMEVSKFFAPVQ